MNKTDLVAIIAVARLLFRMILGFLSIIKRPDYTMTFKQTTENKGQK